jgi:UDP-glucose 4-epimerase
MQRENKSILVTGGLGYVGSHTVTLLLDAGYEVTIVDNCSNTFPDALEKITKISEGVVRWHDIDAADSAAMDTIFSSDKFAGVIHFAAYVSVPESIRSPDKYHANNLQSLETVLRLAMRGERKTPLVVSSSAAVYGDVQKSPLREDEPFLSPPSPYAATKQMGEQMIADSVSAHGGRAVALRYFNAAGAHASGLLGERYRMPAFHLVPVLCEAAAGLRDEVAIFGNDYPTPDGTCIRDYVHVMDVARAHVSALEYLENQDQGGYDVFNIGSGVGYSVKTIVEEFESVNGAKVPFSYKERRAGDPAQLVADISKVRGVLKWEPQLSLANILQTAWRWQNRLQA